MSDRDRAAMERVRALLSVAARFAAPSDPWHERALAQLESTSGLSSQGVELALREHLEVDATDDELVSLLRWAGTAPRCHVVLSANVFVGSVRALALALATSTRVSVKISRRDAGFTQLLLDALEHEGALAALGATVERVSELFARPGEVVHAYGRDETLQHIADTLPDGVLLRAHGTGLSIAVLEADDDLTAAASDLARDVIAFDQRGCLSPRIALVGGGVDEAERLARALHAELGRYDVSIPRGALDPATESALSQYAALLEALGRAFRGRGHVVGLDLAPVRLELGPEARVVHVASAAPVDLAPLLRPLSRWVTAIGLAREPSFAGPLGRAAGALLPAARVARVGELQRPRLDGPVDRRGG